MQHPNGHFNLAKAAVHERMGRGITLDSAGRGGSGEADWRSSATE